MDASAAVNSIVKTPEAESETPTRIQPLKRGGSPFSNANGVLKRHAPPQPQPQHLHPPVVVAYKECLKNHAASIGGHAVDGCGEFMPSPASNPADPTSLKCAACGCHRNFHRREPDEVQPALEYRSHHRHHPPPPTRGGDSGGSSPNDSPSPPPISSSYYPSAPQMLLALSHGASNPVHPGSNPLASAAINAAATPRLNCNSSSRKRFRTKFTQNQKKRMLELAEKVDWKMQKKDDDLISESCTEIGVERGVFKVWMHNNKNTFTKRENHPNPPAAAAAANGVNYTAGAGESLNHNNNNNNNYESSQNHGTNGSSSSS